jgi:acylphosphatase
MSEAVRLIVTGRVQGVGFRDFVARRARALGLAGWVRNRSDGSVEVLAEGDASALEALRAACQGGPPAARVAEVAVVAAEPVGRAGFELLPTATGG